MVRLVNTSRRGRRRPAGLPVTYVIGSVVSAGFTQITFLKAVAKNWYKQGHFPYFLILIIIL